MIIVKAVVLAATMSTSVLFGPTPMTSVSLASAMASTQCPTGPNSGSANAGGPVASCGRVSPRNMPGGGPILEFQGEGDMAGGGGSGSPPPTDDGDPPIIDVPGDGTVTGGAGDDSGPGAAPPAQDPAPVQDPPAADPPADGNPTPPSSGDGGTPPVTNQDGDGNAGTPDPNQPPVQTAPVTNQDGDGKVGTPDPNQPPVQDPPETEDPPAPPPLTLEQCLDQAGDAKDDCGLRGAVFCGAAGLVNPAVGAGCVVGYNAACNSEYRDDRTQCHQKHPLAEPPQK
jgi:hypothetical protein